LDPTQFRRLIEEKEPKLIGFFDELVDIIPKNRSQLNKESTKKVIVGYCYLLAGIRNKFVNNFKLDLGLYLEANGTNAAALDTLSNAGISACYKTIKSYKKKIAGDHQKMIEEYFLNNLQYMHCFNIDDYHSIHEQRRPDSVFLSSAAHMATCVAKKIEDVLAVPAKFNNIPIINPKNIDDSLINTKLVNKYKGIFDISYNDIKSQWINDKILNKIFDRVELLTVHIYDADIEEKKEERSMESVKLIDIKHQSLRSLRDYLLAIKMITNIDALLEYIKIYVIPIIADFPGQLFIRKAITLHMNHQLSGIEGIQNFVPMLGPLHVSLNSRENVILIHYDFFKRLFCTVFEKKKFAQKPKPWHINLLLQLTHDAWLEISKDILEKFEKTKDVEYRMMIIY